MAVMFSRGVPVWPSLIPIMRMNAIPTKKLIHSNCLLTVEPFGAPRCVTCRDYNYINRLNTNRSASLMLSRPYTRKTDGISELSSAVDYLDRCMRDMDRQFRRVFDDLDRFSPIRVPRFFPPWSKFLGRDVPVETAVDGGKTYHLELDLQDFKPEDIKVTVRDRVLTVEARTDKSSDGSRIFREYNHQYVLPEGVITESVRSLLDANGTLTIEAPLAAIESPQPTEIPVQKEKNEKENK